MSLFRQLKPWHAYRIEQIDEEELARINFPLTRRDFEDDSEWMEIWVVEEEKWKRKLQKLRFIEAQYQGDSLRARCIRQLGSHQKMIPGFAVLPVECQEPILLLRRRLSGKRRSFDEMRQNSSASL